MKFKISRTKLVRFIGKMKTEGKRGLGMPKQNHLDFIYIETDGGILKLSGRNLTSTILCRGILEPEEITEEGNIQITDIDKFLKKLKRVRGKTLSFDITSSSVSITDSNGKNIKFPYKVEPTEAAKLKDLQRWDTSHYIEDDTIKFDVRGSTYTFDRWCVIEDGSLLNEVVKDVLDYTNVNEFLMETVGDNLIISAKNQTDKLEIRNPYTLMTCFKEQKFELGRIFPVLSNLSGMTEIYSYLTSKGTIVLWFSNEDMEWQVSYYTS